MTRDEIDARRYRWLRANDNADLLAEDVIDEAIEAEDARYELTDAGREALGGGANNKGELK